MRQLPAVLLIALALGCGSDSPDSDDTESGSSSTTGSEQATGSTSGATTAPNSTTTADDSTSTTSDEDTGSSEETGSSEGDSSSGQPQGLDPHVSWEPLLADATQRAASMMPSASLSLIGARGVGPDGLVDLSNAASEPEIEFRFSDVASDTGVRVLYTENSFDPDADAYEPSVGQINGSGFVFEPLTQTTGLPSFAAIAQGVAATEGCAAFAGTADDFASIRMEYVFASYVVASARTTNGDTEADAFSLNFDGCS